MGDYGLKISKAGFDVKTATDKQLIFSSSFKTHKIKASGTTTKQVPASDTSVLTVTVAHGLSYKPMAEVYASSPHLDYEVYVPYASLSTDGIPGTPAYDWKIDGTNLTIYIQHQIAYGSAVTYTFRYIIFIDKLI